MTVMRTSGSLPHPRMTVTRTLGTLPHLRMTVTRALRSLPLPDLHDKNVENSFSAPLAYGGAIAPFRSMAARPGTRTSSTE